jgi:hypothetical protein
MQDEHEWKEEMTRLLRLLLERMEALERAPTASRPTEIIPKTSLEIIREIKEHSKECRADMERLIRSAALEITRKELNGLKDKIASWETKIFEVGQDAKKTATGQVTTLQGTLELVKSKVDSDHEGRIKVMEAWIIGETRQKLEASAASRWSVSTIFQVVGITAAFGVGLAALIRSIIMG